MEIQLSQLSQPLAEQEICREALTEKYAKRGETSVAEVRQRVAADFLLGERLRQLR